MRALRTVLFVLCLILGVSTAATAAPAKAANAIDGRSISSWVVSALDAVLASFSAETSESDDAHGGEARLTEGEGPPNNEIGAVVDPNG